MRSIPSIEPGCLPGWNPAYDLAGTIAMKPTNIFSLRSSWSSRFIFFVATNPAKSGSNGFIFGKPSLVAERLHRIQAGGICCRIDAENEADGNRYQKCQQDGIEGYDCRPAGHYGYQA